jgi:hypothetical protein
MSRPYESAARSADHYESKARKARKRGPLDETAVAFDQWRRRVRGLPAALADGLAADMTAVIKAEIAKLQPAERGDAQ